eukprot:115280_1
MTEYTSDTLFSTYNITMVSIIDAVLSRWKQLEKFSTLGDIKTSPWSTHTEYTIKLQSHHFEAKQLKIFIWGGDIDILEIDRSISNWKNLEYLSIDSLTQLYELPITFSQLNKIKALILKNTHNVENSMNNLCNMTQLVTAEIWIARDSKIPECIANLPNLERFFVLKSNISSFPLQMLNMTKLQEFNLYSNNITYSALISNENNKLIIDNNEFLNYNHVENITFVLDSNMICDHLISNNNTLFEKWMAKLNACGIGCQTHEGVDGGEFCASYILGNGICEKPCRTSTCNGDNGDCFQLCFTQTDCKYDNYMNGICDTECNNEKCNWDNRKCNDTTPKKPPSQRPTLRNGPGSKGFHFL